MQSFHRKVFLSFLAIKKKQRSQIRGPHVTRQYLMYCLTSASSISILCIFYSSYLRARIGNSLASQDILKKCMESAAGCIFTVWLKQVYIFHWYLNIQDVTFSVNLGENRKFVPMLWFEQELSKYLVSKFVLRYNIKSWGLFHPVCY